MGFPPFQLAGYSAQQNFISQVRALTPSVKPGPVMPLFFQAGQVPGNCAHSTTLTSVLMKELKNNTAITSDSFIDRIFPKEHLSFEIDSLVFEALANKGNWSSSEYLFKGMVYTELGMVDWLNSVGETLGQVYGHSIKHCWWHGTCNLPPSGAPINRKPDLVLLSHKYYTSMKNNPQCVDWLHICSFAEVMTEMRVPLRMSSIINVESYLSFILQFDQHFATALSFIGTGEYSLTVTDCEGQIRYTSSLKSSGL
jgi:hypothetical protein